MGKLADIVLPLYDKHGVSTFEHINSLPASERGPLRKSFWNWHRKQGGDGKWTQEAREAIIDWCESLKSIAKPATAAAKRSSGPSPTAPAPVPKPTEDEEEEEEGEEEERERRPHWLRCFDLDVDLANDKYQVSDATLERVDSLLQEQHAMYTAGLPESLPVHSTPDQWEAWIKQRRLYEEQQRRQWEQWYQLDTVRRTVATWKAAYHAEEKQRAHFRKMMAQYEAETAEHDATPTKMDRLTKILQEREIALQRRGSVYEDESEQKEDQEEVEQRIIEVIEVEDDSEEEDDTDRIQAKPPAPETTPAHPATTTSPPSAVETTPSSPPTEAEPVSETEDVRGTEVQASAEKDDADKMEDEPVAPDTTPALPAPSLATAPPAAELPASRTPPPAIVAVLRSIKFENAVFAFSKGIDGSRFSDRLAALGARTVDDSTWQYRVCTDDTFWLLAKYFDTPDCRPWRWFTEALFMEALAAKEGPPPVVETPSSPAAPSDNSLQKRAPAPSSERAHNPAPAPAPAPASELAPESASASAPAPEPVPAPELAPSEPVPAPSSEPVAASHPEPEPVAVLHVPEASEAKHAPMEDEATEPRPDIVRRARAKRPAATPPVAKKSKRQPDELELLLISVKARQQTGERTPWEEAEHKKMMAEAHAQMEAAEEEKRVSMACLAAVKDVEDVEELWTPRSRARHEMMLSKRLT